MTEVHTGKSGWALLFRGSIVGIGIGFFAAPNVGVGLGLAVSLKEDDEPEMEEDDDEWCEGSPRVIAVLVFC